MTGTLGAVDPALHSPRDAPRRWQAILGLGAVLSLALALRLVFFVGCQGTDDLATWQLATEISHGYLRPQQVMQNPIATTRYGPAFPTAIVFSILGNGERTLMIYPILASLAGIATLWDITRRLTGSLAAAHLAGAIMALASLDINYTTVALPDAPMSAVSWVSIWCAVVASEDGRRARGATWWYFASGVLAGFAVMHKEAAIQLALGLGLWGLIQVINGSFRRPMLMIGAGFVAVALLEHAMFWAAYGDPLARWRIAIDGQARSAAFHQSMEIRPLSYVDRLIELLRLLAWGWPAMSLLAACAAVLAAAVLLLRRRQPVAAMVAAYAASVGLMRLLEIAGTFSFQPRRILPLAGAASVLVPFALWCWVRPGWRRAALSAAFLATLVTAFALKDAMNPVRDASKLRAERWLFRWLQENEALVRERGLYTDERTCKILEAMSGFRDHAGQGIRILAGQAGDEHAYYGARPARYEEGGFFFENVRYVDWLMPRSVDEPSFEIYRSIPASWRLQAVVPHPLTTASNAALYEIASGSPPPADPTRWAWRYAGLGEGARASRAHDEAPLTVEIDPGGGPVTVIGGAGTAIEETAPGGTLCGAGEALTLTWRVAIDPAAGATTGVRPREGASSVALLRVHGIDAAGGATDLYVRTYRLYYPDQELRAYMVPAQDLAGLRIQIELRTAGRFDLDDPLLRRYSSLPFGG